MSDYEPLDMIEEITLNDGSKYLEIGNINHNGRAEYAAEHGKIKSVRILKLNIPRSTNLIKYENYINDKYHIKEETIDGFRKWEHTPEMQKVIDNILKENKLSK